MAFLPSSAPLPPNSVVPPGPVIDTAAVNREFMNSRVGRERVYANLPTAASLWCVSPGTAVDAAQIIPQSELSRQAVLIGFSVPDSLSDQTTLEQILANAPVVSSLNGTPQDTGSASWQSGNMPAPAPVLTIGDLWASGPLPPGTVSDYQQAGTTLTRPRSGKAASTPVLGPACSFAAGVGRGMAGYAPQWGDASLSYQPQPNNQAAGWLWLGIAGLVGLALLSKKRGRR